MTPRRLLAVAVVSGVVAGIYLASPTNGPADRVATCHVRLSDECLIKYPVLKRYETVRFPVLRDVSDGGVSYVLPRALGRTSELVRDCIDIMDWAACTIDSCVTYPTVCALWDAGQPAVRVRAASQYVIPDCRTDGGWDDNHAPVDCVEVGSLAWRGCNVAPRNQRTGAQCLDAPTGLVYAGERVEDSL